MAAPRNGNASSSSNESVDIESLYGLNGQPCKGECKSSLKSNPYCLCRVGVEQATKEMEVCRTAVEDRQSSALRDKNEPAGLKNVGNFCYMNAWIQMMFRIGKFRRCLYEFDGVDDWPTPDKGMNVQWVALKLKDVLFQLQFGTERVTSTTEFVASLGVGKEQQDPQEFGSLILEKLETLLKNHPNGKELSASIETQFGGSYEEVITCGNCGDKTRKPTERFVEISLPLRDRSGQLSKRLYDAMNNFFAPESLDGRRCSRCAKTESVQTRRICRLAPYVFINLKRFTFDAEKDPPEAIKLRHGVQYTKHLDFNDYVTEDIQNGAKLHYNLTAILVHTGSNADNGHYYSLVRDGETREWWKCNDETVTPFDPSRIHEGQVGDADKKAPQTVESKGSYLLLYTVKDMKLDEKVVPPQKYLKEKQESIDAAVLALKEETQTWNKEIDQVYAELEIAEKLVRALKLKTMKAEKVFIPVDVVKTPLMGVLGKFKRLACRIEEISESEKEEETKMEDILKATKCQHNSAGIDNVKGGKWRLVSASAAQKFCKQYELDFDTLPKSACDGCYGNRLQENNLNDVIAADYKQIVALVTLKNRDIKEATKKLEVNADSWTEFDDKFMWVSTKQFFKKVVCDMITAKRLTNGLKSETDGVGPPPKKAKEDVFNSDIICSHGLACPDAQRRLIPTEAWSGLLKLLPDAKPVGPSLPFCDICLQKKRELEDYDDACGKLGTALGRALKAKFDSVVKELTPDVQKRVKAKETFKLVCYHCVDDILLFIDANSNRKKDGRVRQCLVCYECRVCPHDKLNIPVNTKGPLWHKFQNSAHQEPSERYCLLDVATVETVKRCCEQADPLVRKLLVVDWDKVPTITISKDEISSSLAECEECIDEKIKSIVDQLYNYTDGRVQVKLDDEEASSRARKFKKFKTESTDTLLSLKVKLMQEYAVAPNDMTLQHADTFYMASDNEKTLKELSIPRECKMVLFVQPENCEEEAKQTKDKKCGGFKGSVLTQ